MLGNIIVIVVGSVVVFVSVFIVQSPLFVEIIQRISHSDVLLGIALALIVTLVSSLIAATAAYYTTNLQLNKAKELDFNKRLFDARRAAYEKVISVFSFSHNERINNRRYPRSSTDVEAQWKTHEAMGPVILWSGKDLIQGVQLFVGYLNSPLPLLPTEESMRQENNGNIMFRQIIELMRKEVGVGMFADLPVSDLPTKEQAEWKS